MARDHTSAEWTVLELQAAIRNEIRIFETGQQTSFLSSQQVNPTASFYTSLHRKPHVKRETSSKLSCVFCKGNHTTINCDVHKDGAITCRDQATTAVLQLPCSPPCVSVQLEKPLS